MKKVTSLFLALLMLLMTASCASSNPETPDGASSEASGSDTPTAAAEEIIPEETEIKDELPEISFEGSDYVILTRNCCESHTNGIYIEELTGDVVNDAVYDRNMALEERFNIHIAQPPLGGDGDPTMMTASIQAGDNAYDAVLYHYRYMGSSAAAGYLLDTTMANYIDYEKPWWYQGVNDAYSVGGHYYVLTGMYDLDNYYDTVCTYFNINMMNELYPDEDIYSIVKEGRWTADMLETLAEGATLDLDGNGIMDHAVDQFGYGQDNGYSFVYQFSWDQPITSRDDAGIPTHCINTEKQVQVVEKLYHTLFEASPVIKNEDGTARMTAFKEGRCLFMVDRLSASIQLRDMEQDFGIIPMTKFDEAQTNYYSHATAHTTAAGIPIGKTQEEMEKSAIILEAMAAGGFKTIRPAVYDVALKSKYARDDTTYEMIDLVIQGRTADFADVFDNWGLSYTLDILVARSQSKEWASHHKSLSKSQAKLIEKTVTQFMELGD